MVFVSEPTSFSLLQDVLAPELWYAFSTKQIFFV
jgi:hypothetical protein